MAWVCESGHQNGESGLCKYCTLHGLRINISHTFVRLSAEEFTWFVSQENIEYPKQVLSTTCHLVRLSWIKLMHFGLRAYMILSMQRSKLKDSNPTIFWWNTGLDGGPYGDDIVWNNILNILNSIYLFLSYILLKSILFNFLFYQIKYKYNKWFDDENQIKFWFRSNINVILSDLCRIQSHSIEFKWNQIAIKAKSNTNCSRGEPKVRASRTYKLTTVNASALFVK